MESFEGGDSPKFSFCDDDGRAYVTNYVEQSRFRVGDQVICIVRGTDGAVTREGPYIVESVPSTKKYTLCLANGQQVRNGNIVEEKDLELAS